MSDQSESGDATIAETTNTNEIANTTTATTIRQTNTKLEAINELISSLNETLKNTLDDANSSKPISSNVSSSIVDSFNNLIDVLKVVRTLSANNTKNVDGDATQATSNIEPNIDSEADWADNSTTLNVGDDDDDEDDESCLDDSDDDSLCNKLCTYSSTQKEFMNQHWYHCYTCKMIDRAGVCSICARVCHKDHDVTYARYGAFFCDCAAKENGTCIALTKRAATKTNSTEQQSQQSGSSSESEPQETCRDASSDALSCQTDIKKSISVFKSTLLELQDSEFFKSAKEEILLTLKNSNLPNSILELVKILIPIYIKLSHDESNIGRSQRIKTTLNQLHSAHKSLILNNELMLPTLGSQEGAFENVCVNYTGQNATLIKQLLANHTLKRVVMTSLSSPFGKRQHLVVCHEKGKITVLQLNVLLRQADSAKSKLTLTRLAFAPVPFSVISVVANSFNEDVLAVCGLKDCHILTLTPSGFVSTYIEVDMNLTNPDCFIIKALWLSGSESELAILTSDSIKIFNLTKSSSDPCFHFSLVSGTIKDITFIVPESQSARYLIIIDSLGKIFSQPLNSSCQASQGLFYVTSELRFEHSAIREVDGCRNEGGVSIYYSHAFKLLFFSFNSGSFMASLNGPSEVRSIWILDFDSPDIERHKTMSSVNEIEPSESSTKSNKSQPLCQWSEIPNHPGIILAVCLYSNNPVVFMVKPDSIGFQEIKHANLKSKIANATAIRHSTSSGEVRTTLILLCEDGSLRIYMASQENTDYWLRQLPTNRNLVANLQKTRQKQNILRALVKSKNDKQATFPIDFFESCEQMNFIEFGGIDLLSIYNSQQAKNRLSTPGLHIASQKTNGFSIDVINTHENLVVCGIRVQVGCQELERVPSFIEIFGRKRVISPTCARWYDFPLTRGESIMGEKKFTVTFGPSIDPQSITIVDSIKVYGRTKESFSWPDDTEDLFETSNKLTSEEDLLSHQSASIRLLFISAIDALTNILMLNVDKDLHANTLSQLAPNLSSSLLSVPHSRSVITATKDLLFVLLSDRQSYNQHRDVAALNHIATSFKSNKNELMDAELFSRLLSIIKTLCYSKISNLTSVSDNLVEAHDSDDNYKIKLLVNHLADKFWRLHAERPSNQSLVSVASINLTNFEDTLSSLIKIVFLASSVHSDILHHTTSILKEFLLSKDLNLALRARRTIIKLLKVNFQTRFIELDAEVQSHHLLFLERLIDFLPDTREINGYRTVSLMHIILLLFLVLNCEKEKDEKILVKLVTALKLELFYDTQSSQDITERSSSNDSKLIVMRMLSIMMSKIKASTIEQSSSVIKEKSDSGHMTHCSTITAKLLADSEAIEFCFCIIKKLISHWKEEYDASSHKAPSLNASPTTSAELMIISKKKLLKSTSNSISPDLTPFFSKLFVRGSDPLDEFKYLLTELALRIPYQIRKLSSSHIESTKFNDDWISILCEYLLAPIPSHIKKHVRKLLTSICGSKERYRQLRDFHSLASQIKRIKEICAESDESSELFQEDNIDFGHQSLKRLSLSYDSMTSLIGHLKSCTEIAQNRCLNWQVYCLLKDQSLLLFLLRLSLCIGEHVSPVIIELLDHAVSKCQVSNRQAINTLLNESKDMKVDPRVVSFGQSSFDALTPDILNVNLTQQLIEQMPKDLMSKFIQTFLLETNLVTLRLQAHSLLSHLWSNLTRNQQLNMVLVFWSLWHRIPRFGKKASTFVEFISYITIKSTDCGQEYEEMFCQEVLNILRQQNSMLMNHPNAHIYGSLQALVDFDGYYLESEPCLVCNSPEVSYSNLKLNSIKTDSRFTTTSQIFKLVGSYTILRFSLRISEIKKNKMVKTISVLYNNKTVTSVVELKNKNHPWTLARKCQLSPAQTDVKMDFSLPIVACNLLIEVSEVYENFQASNENLQCPRCTTSVSANPGVCSNCGENVFQCHKCRTINYDEKDPFLCNSCGFCKYARFDISLTGKATCAVDPIDNEDDRKKTLSSISILLEKADRIYKNLIQNKPTLEYLLSRIQDQVVLDKSSEESKMVVPMDPQQAIASSNGLASNQSASIIVGSNNPQSSSTSRTNISSVNKAIQHLAQKYCVECRGLFNELSKTINRVLASRKELVDYESKHLKRCLNASSSALSSANRRQSVVCSSLAIGSGKCFGCATATVEQCILILKALTMIPRLRTQICDSGIMDELIQFNLKNGHPIVRQEVRRFLTLLTKDDVRATGRLTKLLLDKISSISKHDCLPYEISNGIRHEIALLSSSLDSSDQCWELRLKCLIKIFAFSLELNDPSSTESLTIPCLKLLLSIVNPSSPCTKKRGEGTLEQISSVKTDQYRKRVILEDWLVDSNFMFGDWRLKGRKTDVDESSQTAKKTIDKQNYRQSYLTTKYFNIWRFKVGKFNKVAQPISMIPNDWLRHLLFHPSSKTVRIMSKSLVESLFAIEIRRREIIDLLTSYLDEVSSAGEYSQEFFLLYKNLIQTDHWRYYLTLKGILMKIGNLLSTEIDDLQELEETTLSSSLIQGYSLKMLLEILSTFIKLPKIRSTYKSKLINFILKGYLSLRKLVVQRTKMIDEAQETLLSLLNSMTTGNEDETAAFITVCVEAIQNCHDSDIRTPIFIFERLCSTIYSEDNVSHEFYIIIEKDALQEDYLQGRMLGNPYSSKDPNIGPLMKDIKNKICQDCELLALLDDDSSMELIVSNKIISLDLPLKEVYKKIWCPDNGEVEPMIIVYRMRGLSGDATEEFIETLDTKENEEIDDEQAFKMANVMGSCGGLEIVLSRLKQIDDLSPPFNTNLEVILKLFSYCVKVKSNRIKLLEPKMDTLSILLNTLRLTFEGKEFTKLVEQSAPSGIQSNSTPKPASSCPKAQLVNLALAVVEAVLKELSISNSNCTHQFSIDIDTIVSLLKIAESLTSRLPQIAYRLINIVPMLTLSDLNRMEAIVSHFKPSMNFESFDKSGPRGLNQVQNLDLFCTMVDAIDSGQFGLAFKDFIMGDDIVIDAVHYLTSHIPQSKNFHPSSSKEWKDFTVGPSLCYVLRILSGLGKNHPSTQKLLSNYVEIIHKLEQISTDTHVATLAENLLESIKEHPAVAEKIVEIRKRTRDEKKRLAMAVRERQLGALGMKANDRGQVIADRKLLEQCKDLSEENGLTCNICREGYKFQPTKIMGIYTYTKRCILDEYEMKTRKTFGYTTVSHFNTVHIECHMSAIKSARSRDEWESAALQNANTRCNGLLPIWGPEVIEHAFSSSLIRYNTNIRDLTGSREVSLQTTLHDIRIQLLRFANERSFSEDTGGGGPESNLHFLPYMMQIALYYMTPDKVYRSCKKNLFNHLMMDDIDIIENCYEVESPYYWTIVACLVLPPNLWQEKRLSFLRRLMLCNHIRKVGIKPPAPINDQRKRSFSYYRSALIYFVLLDNFQNSFKEVINEESWNGKWSDDLAKYLRYNDQAINDLIDGLFTFYQSILQCSSLEEFFVVACIEGITDPGRFLTETLAMNEF